MSEADVKRCTRCGEVKSLDDFHADRSKSDGRTTRCKACRVSNSAAYYAANREQVQQYRSLNRERRAEYGRAWREANRDRRREYERAWRDANREQIRAWRDANREQIRERRRAYREARPHLRWAEKYRHRARKYGFPTVVERFTRDDVIARYGDACAHCGGPFEELDHYPLPVSQGGPHTLENVRPSCTACNRRTWRQGGNAM